MRIAVAGGTGLVGRHVVAQAEYAGHDALVLSRSRGVDVLSGEGLAGAVEGVAAIVDVTNAGTADERAATEFFTRAAGNLQRVGAERGVGHVVTLSIVGIDRVPFGYYAAKLEQERVSAAGSVPSSVLRATQFHEFPAQLISWTRTDSRAQVLELRVQTVAARTVAAVLLELATGEPREAVPDLAGPEQADLVDLARAFVERRGLGISVEADSDSVAGMPPGAMLPGPEARIEGPTFDQWLSSEDAAVI
jgi:uncharacterized protein YbjT (DUF2867 family)